MSGVGGSRGAVSGGDFYARTQAQGQEALREGLLDLAAEMLATDGPGALTMRRIATEAGCSTTVLYRHFGAKGGIAEALYLEGFERMRRRLEAVAVDDDGDGGPAGYLAALGRAYRENALAERNLYQVMFARAIPGFVPGDQARAAARANLAVLREAVQSCVEAGVLRPGLDVDVAADTIWAAAHGVISLELAGHFESEAAEQLYRTLTRAAVAEFLDPQAEADPFLTSSIAP